MKITIIAIFALVLLSEAKLKQYRFTKGKTSPLDFERKRLRSSIDYCNQVACATARSCISYMGYGCYCGFPQVGKPAVDAIDQCCKDHSECYQKAALSEFCWAIHFEPYNWHCAAEQDGTKSPVCDDEKNKKCQKIACGCDKTASECLAAQEYPKVKPTCPLRGVPFLWMKLGWPTL